jgi:ubiquinone/menaquinone biosynthesis C-methylase UbiE
LLGYIWNDDCEEVMNHKNSNLKFKMMTKIGMPIRNKFMPPAKMLEEVEIKKGYNVLDYGCGPGTFSKLLSKIVGETGSVYALDVHPLAIQSVEKIIKKENLTNIITIHSDCSTNLADNSLDLVVFFDVFHVLTNQHDVLKELHRVLKPEGTMCFSDHHMNEKEILNITSKNNLFELSSKGTYIYQMKKNIL